MDYVWEQARSHNLSTWPIVRETNIKFKMPSSAALLARLPVGALVEEGSTLLKRYRLTFLGALLTTSGQRCEDLLIQYLEFVRGLARADHATNLIKSKDVGAGMRLEAEDVILLGQAIALGNFYGTQSSGGGPAWSCDVPSDLDALMNESDLRPYVRRRAFSPSLAQLITNSKGLSLPDRGPAAEPSMPTPAVDSSPHSSILLEPEQVKVLELLVEASRSVPSDQRRPFRGVRQYTGQREVLLLIHPGIGADHPGLYPGDIEQLAEERLLRLQTPKSGFVFEVTPLGFAHYEWRKMERGGSVARVQSAIRDYFDTRGFGSRHVGAYSKLQEAERLLWGAESAAASTMIGHLCREAHQEFATSLLVLYPNTEAPAETQMTKARVKAALATAAISSSRVAELADALGLYWSATIDLAQRQEHGTTNPQDPLTWEDSRRLVFVTLHVMSELDRVCQGPSPTR